MRSRGHRGVWYGGSGGGAAYLLAALLYTVVGTGLALLLTLAVLDTLPAGGQLVVQGVSMAGAGLAAFICRKNEYSAALLFIAFEAVGSVAFLTNARMIWRREALFLEPLGPVVWGSAAAALFVAGVVFLRRRSGERKKGRLPICILVWLVCFSLTYNLTLDVNVLADPEFRRAVEVPAAEVGMERRGGGKGSYPYWYVELTENGLLNTAARLPISKEVYETAQPGETFRLTIHRGALGIAWAKARPVTPEE